MPKEDLFTPNCIRSFTGKYVDVFNPTGDMFCIEDIAHALSQMPRFGGHLPHFYSVGQHSLECLYSMYASNYEIRLTALMHDATEAYLLDMPSPNKKRLKDYIEIEKKLNIFLSNLFGFIYPFPACVEATDYDMLRYEWDHLMIHQDNLSKPMVDIEKTFLINYYNLKS